MAWERKLSFPELCLESTGGDPELALDLAVTMVRRVSAGSLELPMVAAAARRIRREPAGVGDFAAGDDETHAAGR